MSLRDSYVIILVIAVVLLIPVNVFAQEESSDSYDQKFDNFKGFRVVELIQINATVIVGVLILLTISSLTHTSSLKLSLGVKAITVPFVISSVLGLLVLDSSRPLEFLELLVSIMIVTMLVGFTYIALVLFFMKTKKP